MGNWRYYELYMSDSSSQHHNVSSFFSDSSVKISNESGSEKNYVETRATNYSPNRDMARSLRRFDTSIKSKTPL